MTGLFLSLQTFYLTPSSSSSLHHHLHLSFISLLLSLSQQELRLSHSPRKAPPPHPASTLVSTHHKEKQPSSHTHILINKYTHAGKVKGIPAFSL